jgi:pyridoxamine 5'-phosphate oxidase
MSELAQTPLLEENLNKNAMKQFKTWFYEAESSGVIADVNVAVLSTVDEELVPHSRCMTIIDFNKKGFIFNTSLSSQKVKHFTQNSNVTLVFPWTGLNRQVIINGTVKKMNDKKSEMYFDKRNFLCKIGMTTNKQSSKVVASRKIIDDTFNKKLTKYNNDGVHIKKPDHICAFIIIPQSIEFFQSRSLNPDVTKRIFNYFDRLRYVKDGSKWSITRFW